MSAGEHVKTILVIDYGNDEDARKAVEAKVEALKDARDAASGLVPTSQEFIAAGEALRQVELDLAKALWECEHFESRQWWKDAERVAKGSS